MSVSDRSAHNLFPAPSLAPQASAAPTTFPPHHRTFPPNSPIIKGLSALIVTLHRHILILSPPLHQPTGPYWPPLSCPAPAYPIIIGGVRVLITGDDLWGHPVRGPNESVSSAHSAVQLSTHPKIHCRHGKGVSTSPFCSLPHFLTCLCASRETAEVLSLPRHP